MAMEQLRRMTDSGIDTMIERLIAVSKGQGGHASLAEILETDGATAPLSQDVAADMAALAECTGKYEFGVRFIEAVGPDAASKLLADDNFWAWLSLRLAETVMPERAGVINPGGIARHVVVQIGSRSGKARHRHLLRGAVNAVLRFGSLAEALMGSLTTHSTFEEQIMSRSERQQLAGSPEFVRAVNILYWNAAKKKLKPASSKGAWGSMMRLIQVTQQLETNYPVALLTAEELIALLPKREFGRFL